MQSRHIQPFVATTRPLTYDLCGVSLAGELTLRPGYSIVLPAGVSNAGTGPVHELTRTSVFWSTDRTRSSDDRELSFMYSVINEGFNSTSYTTIDVTIPTDAAAGSYYLLQCIDSTNIIVETDEDNCRALPVRIASPFRQISITDLQPVSGSPGEFVTLSFAVKNTGDVPNVADNEPNYSGSPYSIRWSADPIIASTDPEVAIAWIDRLPPGKSVPFALNLQIPARLPAGTHYFGFCPTSYELDLSHCSVLPVSVVSNDTIDLSVSDLTLSTTNVPAGESVSMSFVVVNDGNTQRSSRWRAKASSATAVVREAELNSNT